MQVERNIPLAPLTTLGLGGPAKRFARVETIAELQEALREPRILVLGGGSNLVVGDAGWDGLVVQIALAGVTIENDRVSVMAGVVWDDFVAHMIDAGRAGVECLSGIPGLVGATPMQNVGAYGQEVSDTIAWVRVLDRTTGELATLPRETCGFAYRSSVFRGSARWIVVEVCFELPCADASAPIRYAELARTLGVPDGGRAPLRAVRDAVIGLRRGKGMIVDPADPESRSAGSFFTNPIVDAAQLAAVEARVGPGMPRWPAGDQTKLSAAWLIEKAGFTKGYTVGHVGISRKHALALVNRGGATTGELLALARAIHDAVRDLLGVELVPEPIIT